MSAPYLQDADFTLYCGDALDVLREMSDESVHCCVTSPPYWGLRDYGAEGQLGLEPTPDAYVARLVQVFRQVRRVLRDDGTCWINLGDSYASNGPRGDTRSGFNERYFGSGAPGKQADTAAQLPDNTVPVGLKPKDLVGIPWRVAFALQADGWWLRSDIIWAKPNPMPESVTDRPTKAHEYVFLLTKSARYFYDAEALREPASWERWGDQTIGPGSNPDGWIKPKTKQELTGGRQARRYDAEHFKTTDERNTRFQGPDPEDGRRNGRTVWTIASQPYAEAHFATFPLELPRRCIAAGSPAGGTVLDPFAGSGTTALVARQLGRNSIGIELNPDYCALAAKRLQQQTLFAEPAA